MRISLFSAFASNNSGSYTIVGSFQDEGAAEEVARLLREVSDAHTAWREEHDGDDDEDLVSPLDVFAREHGLRAQKPGRDDEWPQYGPKPSVVAIGYQVLVHAP